MGEIRDAGVYFVAVYSTVAVKIHLLAQGIESDRKFAYWVDVAVDEEDTDRGIANTQQGLRCVCVCVTDER